MIIAINSISTTSAFSYKLSGNFQNNTILKELVRDSMKTSLDLHILNVEHSKILYIFIIFI